MTHAGTVPIRSVCSTIAPFVNNGAASSSVSNGIVVVTSTASTSTPGLLQVTSVSAAEDCTFVLSAWGHVSGSAQTPSFAALWADNSVNNVLFSEFTWMGGNLPVVNDVGVSNVSALTYRRVRAAYGGLLFYIRVGLCSWFTLRAFVCPVQVTTTFDTSSVSGTGPLRVGVLFSGPAVGSVFRLDRLELRAYRRVAPKWSKLVTNAFFGGTFDATLPLNAGLTATGVAVKSLRLVYKSGYTTCSNTLAIDDRWQLCT